TASRRSTSGGSPPRSSEPTSPTRRSSSSSPPAEPATSDSSPLLRQKARRPPMTTPDTQDSAGANPRATDVVCSKGAPGTTPSNDTVTFVGDVGVSTLKDAVRAYIAKVRGGEPGALPALFGLIVLVVSFSQLSKVFFTVGNLANLTGQAGFTIIFAMGLVFVLLLGEIDLSAGTAGGLCAATMAIVITKNGDLHAQLGGGTYGAAVLAMFCGL